MRLLEGAEACRATATGMAAVTSALLILPQGRRPHRRGAGAVRVLPLRRRGAVSALRHRLHAVDGRDLGAWETAIKPNTKAFFFETPANPTLDLVDIARGVEASRTHAGALVFVDNVFATPLLQKPLTLGADVVIYSATKHIDGQGRCLGGVILCSEKFLKDHLQTFLRQTGPSLSPVQRLGAAQGPRDAAPARARAVCDGGGDRGHLGGKRRHQARAASAAAPIIRRRRWRARQMTGGGQIVTFEVDGGKAGGLPLPQCAADHPHFEQPRRCQEHHHASGDDDAPAPETRGARRTRHQRWHAAPVGRP